MFYSAFVYSRKRNFEIMEYIRKFLVSRFVDHSVFTKYFVILILLFCIPVFFDLFNYYVLVQVLD